METKLSDLKKGLIPIHWNEPLESLTLLNLPSKDQFL